jgi:hypothetical protein
MDLKLARHGFARLEADRHAKVVAKSHAHAAVGRRGDPEALEFGRGAYSTAEEDRR